MPPHWTSPQHPIVQRELALWHKRTARWGWLWFLFMLAPCACGGLCNLFTLPALIDANTFNEALLFLGWMIFMTLNIFQGFLMFSVWLLISLGTATVIARERETQNWELLRLTTLNLTEVVYAKVMGVIHWLRIPLGLAFVARVLIVILGFGAMLTAIYIGNTIPTGIPTPAIALVALSAMVALVALLYFILDLVLNIFYSTAIGTLASTWARTSANAVALMFIMHFIISFFVMAPLQQMALVFSSLMMIPLTSTASPSPLLGLLFPVVSVGSNLLLAVAIQLGLGALAYALALNQAKHITE